VVSSWFNTKEKLVGLMLDRDLHPIAVAAAILGLAMIALAGYLTVRR
jgi:hypothetical protein